MVMKTETLYPAINGQEGFIGDSESSDVITPPIPQQKKISGLRKEIIEILIYAGIVKILWQNYKHPRVLLKVLRSLIKTRRMVLGNRRIRKVVCVDGKYYWDLYTPGYRSKAFTRFIEGEANRVEPLTKKTNRFTNVFVAFTKKCHLQCEHCFEWDVLNKRESLSLDDTNKIVQRFQDQGTAQIQLTGGEPLLRVNQILDILQAAKKNTDFWILTSGYNLTLENARRLKAAGVTGVAVSLDHYDADHHNKFRGSEKSFMWAMHAIRNAIDSGLVTCLSLCPVRSFVSRYNLIRYAELAKELGVSFMQILEPKAVGHYAGEDVALNPEQEKILDEFYISMNYERTYESYPIVTYHGYHQRRTGCFASGNRNLYVDTDGDLRACPFCMSKKGNVLTTDLDTAIGQLQAMGCHRFKSFDGKTSL